MEAIGPALAVLLGIFASIGWWRGWAFPVAQDIEHVRRRFERPGRKLVGARRIGLDFGFWGKPIRQYEVSFEDALGQSFVRLLGLQNGSLGQVWWRHDAQHDRWVRI